MQHKDVSLTHIRVVEKRQNKEKETEMRREKAQRSEVHEPAFRLSFPQKMFYIGGKNIK